MKITETSLSGVIIIDPVVYKDNRGYFLESFNESLLDVIKVKEFKQDNISCSHKNVVRGLHYQKAPHAQGKLVTVMRGSVMDVAVDIRESSPTYGQYISVILSEDNNRLLWLPEGIAHGFVSLEDNTVFHYKCTDVYNKESEASIKWDDTDLNIKWGCHNPIVSDKDQIAKSFKESKGSFN